MARSLGWIPTPANAIYNTYSGPPPHLFKATQLPETLDMRPDLTPVRDQGSQGTCVAQSGACMREYQAKKDIDYSYYLSPQFIYNNRYNYPGEGMMVTDLMMILHDKGIAQEYVYPYGKVEPTSAIPQPVFQDATNFTTATSARILPTGNQIADLNAVKTSLVTNGPCVITFNVYNWGPTFWRQEPGQMIVGGHAVVIVGYTKDSFIIRNSWGGGWADKGYTYLPFSDYQARVYQEIWTSVKNPSHVVPPPPQPPAPKCCGDSKCIIM